ncbi:MAG: hypothetical protein FWC95_04750, partial [Defluviitaleaceae bacterium]|nr:hypothetical protein [Defluviitaleaceae bacterium]
MLGLKRVLHKFICYLLAVLFVVALPSISLRVIAGDAPITFNEAQGMLDTFGAFYRFSDFLADHALIPIPHRREVIIAAADYTYYDGMVVRIYEDFEGKPGASVWTDEEGIITWEVYVPVAGLYNIAITYFIPRGRNSDVQRAVLINNELQFFEANPINFRRTWVNLHDEILRDPRGHDIRPTLIEQHLWREAILQDHMGDYNEYLSFFFQQGLNTISLVSQREAMIINSIRLFRAETPISYAEYSAGFADAPRPDVETKRIEGQDAVRRSSQMLAPAANMGGPGVYPLNPRYIRINYIGGAAWSNPGMWIEWDIEIDEPGLYKIALNVQQNFNRGAMAFRRISINGVVPFSELDYVPFHFSNRWQVVVLGGDDPFLFYFEEGVHTIRMETVLGGYAPYLREIQASIANLNRIYRQVLTVTGIVPDVFRDYHLNRRIPTLYDDLRYERDRLVRVFDGLMELSDGNISERDVVIRTMINVLDRILQNVDDMPRHLAEFRIRIGGLGSWLMQAREQPLRVDAIFIMSADAELPSNRDGFWARLWHGIVSLVLSFFIDFNALGATGEDGVTRIIEVWIGTGRDQLVALRTMIDETFTPQTGIGVNLMLVDMSMLLPATVSGQGPDVAMFLPIELPMNFAFRGAVAELSGFPGFDDVAGRFAPAAIVPFMYGDRAFALPDTLTFYMMF